VETTYKTQKTEPTKKIIRSGLSAEFAFLFDNCNHIACISKGIYILAEQIAITDSKFKIKTERQFYSENIDIDNIDVLIDKAVPILARLLHFESVMEWVQVSSYNTRVLKGLVSDSRIVELVNSFDLKDLTEYCDVYRAIKEKRFYKEEKCVICLENPSTFYFTVCKHVVLCADCMKLLPNHDKCVVCCQVGSAVQKY
jgi:hypothetical protein